MTMYCLSIFGPSHGWVRSCLVIRRFTSTHNEAHSCTRRWHAWTYGYSTQIFALCWLNFWTKKPGLLYDSRKPRNVRNTEKLVTESLVGRQARYSPEGCHYLWFVPIWLLSISSHTCSSAISPWQTKAAPNMFREYLFNGYRRMAGEFKFWAIPFGVGTQHPRFMLSVSQLSKIAILQAMLSTRGPRVTTTIRIARQVISHREQRTTRALEIGNSHNLLILLDRSFLNFYQRVFQATLKIYYFQDQYNISLPLWKYAMCIIHIDPYAPWDTGMYHKMC